MTPTRPLAGPGNGKGAKGSNISNPSRHGTPAPSATDHIGISEQGRAAHMPLHTCRCTHADWRRGRDHSCLPPLPDSNDSSTR